MHEWYVVVAKNNQDHLAARGLREQGYADVYLPKRYERKFIGKRKVPVAHLLLPPYIYVFLDASDEKKEHAPIRSIRGVDRLLADNPDKPSPLRGGGQRFIARLRQAEDEEMFAATSTPLGREDLRRGMHVRVDKPGISVLFDGKAVPMTGRIIFIERRKVTILVDGSRDREVTIDAVDVSETEPV